MTPGQIRLVVDADGIGEIDAVARLTPTRRQATGWRWWWMPHAWRDSESSWTGNVPRLTGVSRRAYAFSWGTPSSSAARR